MIKFLLSLITIVISSCYAYSFLQEGNSSFYIATNKKNLMKSKLLFLDEKRGVIFIRRSLDTLTNNSWINYTHITFDGGENFLITKEGEKCDTLLKFLKDAYESNNNIFKKYEYSNDIKINKIIMSLKNRKFLYPKDILYPVNLDCSSIPDRTDMIKK